MKRTGKPLCTFVALLGCLLLSNGALAQLAGESVEVVVGQTSVLNYDQVRRISIGDDDKLDVRVLRDARQILIIGESVGRTDLRVWLRNGNQFIHQVRVIDEPLADKLARINDLLAPYEGVRASIAGDQIVIDGQTLTDADSARVRAIAEQFGIGNFTTAAGLTPRAMILMDVKVMELRKTSLKDIGIRWDSITTGPNFGYFADFSPNDFFRINNFADDLELTGPALPLDLGNQTYLGTTTSLTSMLNLLAENGFGRFLAEPQLTCRSGGSASFIAGGEVPIPLTDDDGALNVQFKQFGIILNMSPISDPSGFISTSVDVEVSSVDESLSVLGIPGFSTRKTTTEMNVQSGQTMVISGLVSSDASKTVGRLPGLGNLPVIGELFKSRQFSNEETELVVFVTPHLVTPDSPRVRERIDRVAEMEKIAEDELRFKLMD